MKISVITATYNSASTIRDTIESLLKQTYHDIEYIVVDGASRDSTLQIVNEYQDVVTHIVSEPDRGIYDALNKGIALASGDVVGFLHSDDLFAHEQVLEQVAECFVTHGTDAVYGDLEYVAKEDTATVIRYWRSGSYNPKRLAFGWMPAHPTFYLKRECYQQFGAFDLTYRIAADYDSILRYLHKNRCSAAYIDGVMVKMRVGGASNRSLTNILKKTQEDLRAVRSNGAGGLITLLWKNLSKIPQFVQRSQGATS